MIINHNMPALNTYRQLSINNGNTQKSLEKLSSGLRINKAGDDAAGLAISEKMRGQIRGLDQASRNSQDGISMLNTAEGSLSETHSILQRMKELATQAANDTNVGVDRNEIQKEINQLTSEINRIGNTTEFNTQKLLNGGGIKTDLNIKTLTQGAAKGDMGGAVVAASSTGVAAVDQYTFGTELATNGSSGTFKFNGMTVKLFRGADAGAASATYAVDAAAKSVTINVTGSAAGTIAATTLGGYVRTALNTYQSNTNTYELANFTVAGAGAAVTFTTSTPSAGRVDFLNNAAISTSFTAGTTSASTAGSYVLGATDETAKLTIMKNSSSATAAEWAGTVTAMGASETALVSFNGVTVNMASSATGAIAAAATDSRTATVTVANGATAEDNAKALKAAFEAAQSFGGAELKNFTFSVRGSGANAQFVVTDKASNGTTNNSLTVGISTTGALRLGGGTTLTTTTAGVNEVRGEYTYDLKKAFEAANTTITIAGKTFTAVTSDAKASSAQFNVGTDANQQVIELAAAMNADTSISARFDVIADGAKLKMVEKAAKAAGTVLTDGVIKSNTARAGKYSFNIDSSVPVGGKYSIDGVDIRVTDDASDAGLTNGTAVMYDATTNGQASKLNQAIAANSTLSAKYTSAATSSLITLTQKTNNESMTAVASSTNTNAAGAFKATFQVGANTGQSMTIEVNDMRSKALEVVGVTAGGKASVNGAVFTSTKNVTNGTDNTNVEYALDVSSHEKATAAIQVISNAIESVSAERSKLGAYTNGLEHTIANLGTASENTTAAESRIRDVDMAKEMVQFQKNNILSQAAQAMLAQANQQPQGVLQLLR